MHPVSSSVSSLNRGNNHRFFRVRYPGSPLAEKTFVDCFLQKEGWEPYTQQQDNEPPDLLLIPYSSIDWTSVLNPFSVKDTTKDIDNHHSSSSIADSVVVPNSLRTTYVSSYPIRTAIVRKDKLANLYPILVQHAQSLYPYNERYRDIIQNSIPITLSTNSLDDFDDTPNLQLEEEDGSRRRIVSNRNSIPLPTIESVDKHNFIRQNYWVKKKVSTNNALGIEIMTGIEALRILQKNTEAQKKCTLSLSVSSVPTTSSSDTTVDKDTTDDPPSPVNSPSVIFQQYVTTPLLYKQSKFHCRVNVMVFGSQPIGVYIHRDIICHVSCEPWSLPYVHDSTTKNYNDDNNHNNNSSSSLSLSSIDLQRFIHITNHTVQRMHPHYQRKTHTLPLEEIIHHLEQQSSGIDSHNPNRSSPVMNKESAMYRQIFDDICLIIQTIFSALTSSTLKKTKSSIIKATEIDSSDVNKHTCESTSYSNQNSIPFLPIPNAFEIYGFDFLLSTEPLHNKLGGSVTSDVVPATSIIYPVLLEINAGPALEGLAWPLMCRRVVGDIVDLIDQFIPIPLAPAATSSSSSLLSNDDPRLPTVYNNHNNNNGHHINNDGNINGLWKTNGLENKDYCIPKNRTVYPVPPDENGFIRIL